jgi:hypothetical protein
MKKTLRYNFRLKPTAEQEVKLVEFGAYARGLWIVSGALIIPIVFELKKALLVSQKSAKCLLLCIEN